MTKRVRNCVGCGIPGCMNCMADVTYCDICGEDDTVFSLDGDDYCEHCLQKFIKAEWASHSVQSKIDLLKAYYWEDIERDEVDSVFDDMSDSEKAECLGHRLL